MSDTQKHAGGRPTDYKPEYCEDIIAYFDIPKTVKVTKWVTTKGESLEVEMDEANDPVFFIGFAEKVGVTLRTLYNWADNHVEFLHAMSHAKELTARHIALNALRGNFEPRFSQFFLKNVTDWKDKSEVEVEGKLDLGVVYLPAKLPVGAPVPEIDNDPAGGETPVDDQEAPAEPHDTTAGAVPYDEGEHS